MSQEIKDFLGEVSEAAIMMQVNVEVDKDAMGNPGVRFIFQKASPLFHVEDFAGLGAPMIVEKVAARRAEIIAHGKRIDKENKDFRL